MPIPGLSDIQQIWLLVSAGINSEPIKLAAKEMAAGLKVSLLSNCGMLTQPLLCDTLRN